MATVCPLEVVRLDRITRDPNNAYSHEDGDIQRLHGVIQEYGFLGSLVVDEGYVLIGGEARHEVLTQLGFDEVPVNVVADLSTDERTALAISLNASFGAWNESRLKQQLLDLRSKRYDLDLTGLKPFEIDKSLDLSRKKDLNPSPRDQGAPNGTPILSFQVIFDNEVEQAAFYQFGRYLKGRYPEHATLSNRLTAYVAELSTTEGFTDV